VHELDGGRVRLAPLTRDQAGQLGSSFAAINPWATYPYPASALEAYLALGEAGAPRFGIYFQGTLAGALGLRLAWLRGPYVQFLGILPPFQGHGLGGLLIAWLEEEARAQGERNLWVAASDFNTDALHFYERHGFVHVAALAGLVRDERTEILLRKVL